MARGFEIFARLYRIKQAKAVHIMLLPSQKPSSSYSLLKFVYVTAILRHPSEVLPLLGKIVDPPLRILLNTKSGTLPLVVMEGDEDPWADL